MGVTLWTSRRIWKSTRRLAARTRGHEQLVELGQLSGGLAHELKNPLSTINVNLQLLSEDLQRLDDPHQRLLPRLTSVRDETNRLRDILDDFLRYAGKYDLNLREVDIRALVEELADFFTPQAEARKVILRSLLPERPVRCKVDEKLLKQAILNLMINAADAMNSPGELLIKVSINRDKADLEIIDTGAGIDPEVLPRIFDVYYSTKTGGSGLGLSTTRRIVREHGGTISVESEPGKGTRFVISLPLTG